MALRRLQDLTRSQNSKGTGVTQNRDQARLAFLALPFFLLAFSGFAAGRYFGPSTHLSWTRTNGGSGILPFDVQI